MVDGVPELFTGDGLNSLLLLLDLKHDRVFGVAPVDFVEMDQSPEGHQQAKTSWSSMSRHVPGVHPGTSRLWPSPLA